MVNIFQNVTYWKICDVMQDLYIRAIISFRNSRTFLRLAGDLESN